MKEYKNNNKEVLYEEKPSSDFFLLFIIIGLIIIVLFSYILEMRESKLGKGIYHADTQTIQMIFMIEDIPKLKQYEIVKINDKVYPFDIVKIGEMQVDSTNLVNYQIIEIKTKEKFMNNEIIDIYLLDKKEKLMFKIIKKLRGE